MKSWYFLLSWKKEISLRKLNSNPCKTHRNKWEKKSNCQVKARLQSFSLLLILDCLSEKTLNGTVSHVGYSVEALTEQSVFNGKYYEMLLDDANSFIEKEVQSLISKISTIDNEITLLKDVLKD